jgi:hypothetical protein
MEDRRNLLKGLAVSTAWATPVVSSVMLPVHAETSFTFPCSGGTCSVTHDESVPIGFGLLLLDGVVSVSGTHIGCQDLNGGFEGSAPINQDGSFSITTTGSIAGCIFPIVGTITNDCSSVTGTSHTSDNFSSDLEIGVTDLSSCPDN